MVAFAFKLFTHFLQQVLQILGELDFVANETDVVLGVRRIAYLNQRHDKAMVLHFEEAVRHLTL